MTSVIAYDKKKRRIPLIVTDIGEGGIGISSKEKLAVGDVLFLNLPLVTGKKPICMEARVLWTREYGTAGCEFVRMLPVNRDILRQWLRQKMRIKQPASID
jgi:hypothetical protein